MSQQKRSDRNFVLVFFIEFFTQTFILSAKNFLLYLRRWKSTLVQIFSPLLVVVLLFIITKLIEAGTPKQYVNPPDVQFSRKLLRCYRKGTKSCVTIRYTTNGDSMSAQVINRVIATQSHIPEKEIVEYATEEAMLSDFNSRPNTTLYAVSLVGDRPYFIGKPTEEQPETTATRYVIYVNATDPDKTHETLALSTMIDNAIASLRLGVPYGEYFVPTINGWPMPPDKKNGQISLFTLVGPQFFSISSMIILVVSLYSLVVEKEKKLRFGMKMMGLRDIAFYVSWFGTFTVIAFFTSLVSVFSGMAFKLTMFLKTNWFVLFAMFFTFMMCLVCLAFLLSTLVNTGKAALILGFTILAISFILNMFIANGNAIYNLYQKGSTRALPAVLNLYPPYDFAKIFSDISYPTLPKYDEISRQYIPGPGYKWKDLYKKNTYFDSNAPPTAASFYIMLVLSVLYLIVAWYLDNVLPGATGIARRPWFFLQPSYYGFRVGTSVTSFRHKEMGTAEYPNEPVRKEAEDVQNGEIPYALRIVNLKKHYDKFFGLIKSFNALRGLSIGVLPGNCLAFLGHNGAGKSTTMNILTGLIGSSGGEAFIFGRDIRYEMDAIRKQIGVCPQHDILWDELTAREHLYIFGLFKDVPVKQLKAQSEYLLSKVNLLKVADHRTSSFSGGMKRRLSVAIACIGDPELLLLDEPTTGMDPSSRRQVWDLIEEMKGGKKTSESASETAKERVIVLTTHSMEEADALSDRISIMANGQLQAIGYSLSLKRQFGQGYTLTIVSCSGRADDVEKLALKHLPEGSKTISQHAGSFIYQIPDAITDQLSSFLEVLEEESARDGSCIKDWGISDTTLEQVYLIVTELAERKDDEKVETSVEEIGLEPTSPKKVFYTSSLNHESTQHLDRSSDSLDLQDVSERSNTNNAVL